jgi:hypothetical protein
MARDFYVYLKLQSYKGSNIQVNTIPLRVTSIGVSTDKTIPSFGIPFSSLVTGESVTLALDLATSNKQLNLSGFITDMELTKKFGNNDPITREFTAAEIAQMISSGVDATGIAHNQAFQELVVMIPSKVDSNYNARASEVFIPLTFAARGDALEFDNERVPIPSSFPDSDTDEGLTGFIRNFNYTLSAETQEIEFSMDFQVATILP